VTGPEAPGHRGRSVGAVVAGFALTAGLSLGMDAVMHATGVFPPWGEPMPDGLYAWATVYRIAFTVTGGYLTARLAPRRPMRHVIALGVVGLVAATAGAAATWNAGPAFGPRWYPLALIGTALPSVWAGGILQGHLNRE
jgi:hypothetical protein